MTRRAELLPVIRDLREGEGLTWREVGERLGLSLQTVHGYYSDPEGLRAAAAKAKSQRAHRQPCPECGTLMSQRAKRCVQCWDAERRRVGDATRETVRQLHNAGTSMKEIARRLGYGPSSMPSRLLDELRRDGLIGYRYRGYGDSASR